MNVSSKLKSISLVAIAFLGIVLMVIFFYENLRDEKASQEGTFEKIEVSEEKISLPKPTGKTDDVLKGALAGLEAEMKNENDEENLAKDIIEDSDEVSDFSSNYEKVEF